VCARLQDGKMDDDGSARNYGITLDVAGRKGRPQ
jgi:hypothetical protein